MEKNTFGKITDGLLITSPTQREGYKPLVYAAIPEGFDQETQFIVQLDAVDQGKDIYLGVEVKELPVEDPKQTERMMEGIL